jgi:hypothetical protein
MSKSDKVNKTAGAAASRSKSAQKVLDIERRFIDDPIQARFGLLGQSPGDATGLSGGVFNDSCYTPDQTKF